MVSFILNNYGWSLMNIKQFYSSIFIALILFSASTYSQPSPLNIIGCIIVNEDYLINQPKLLTGSAELSMKTGKDELIYRDQRLTLKVESATVIEAASRRPWISSFKLSLLQVGQNTISVKSAPRSSDTDDMNINLVIRDSTDSGELFIECNARQ